MQFFYFKVAICDELKMNLDIAKYQKDKFDHWTFYPRGSGADSTLGFQELNVIQHQSVAHTVVGETEMEICSKSGVKSIVSQLKLHQLELLRRFFL